MSANKFKKTVLESVGHEEDLTKMYDELLKLSLTLNNNRLIACIIKYLEEIFNIICAAKSFKKQLELSKECMNIFKDIILKDKSLTEKFLQNCTEKIFGLIIEEDTKNWLFKKEILNFFNCCQQRITKSARLQIAKNLNEIYLLKLVDSISTFSDYDFQVILIEGIFRLYGRALINEKLKDIFPESEQLSQRFAEINPSTFDEDVRGFLNSINKCSGKIYSAVCQSVKMDDILCQPPLDFINGLWVDFNVPHKVITWYCTKDSFNEENNKNEEDATIWNLITVFADSIETITIHNDNAELQSVLMLKLNSPCISFHEDVQPKVNEISSIVILLEKTEEYLITNILPVMFPEKINNLTQFDRYKTSKADYSDFGDDNFEITKLKKPKKLYSPNETGICSILEVFSAKSMTKSDGITSLHSSFSSELSGVERDIESMKILSGRSAEEHVKFTNRHESLSSNLTEVNKRSCNEEFFTADNFNGSTDDPFETANNVVVSENVQKNTKYGKIKYSTFKENVEQQSKLENFRHVSTGRSVGVSQISESTEGADLTELADPKNKIKIKCSSNKENINNLKVSIFNNIESYTDEGVYTKQKIKTSKYGPIFENAADVEELNIKNFKCSRSQSSEFSEQLTDDESGSKETEGHPGKLSNKCKRKCKVNKRSTVKKMMNIESNGTNENINIEIDEKDEMSPEFVLDGNLPKRTPELDNIMKLFEDNVYRTKIETNISRYSNVNVIPKIVAGNKDTKTDSMQAESPEKDVIEQFNSSEDESDFDCEILRHETNSSECSSNKKIVVLSDIKLKSKKPRNIIKSKKIRNLKASEETYSTVSAEMPDQLLRKIEFQTLSNEQADALLKNSDDRHLDLSRNYNDSDNKYFEKKNINRHTAISKISKTIDKELVNTTVQEEDWNLFNNDMAIKEITIPLMRYNLRKCNINQKAVPAQSINDAIMDNYLIKGDIEGVHFEGTEESSLKNQDVVKKSVHNPKKLSQGSRKKEDEHFLNKISKNENTNEGVMVNSILGINDENDTKTGVNQYLDSKKKPKKIAADTNIEINENIVKSSEVTSVDGIPNFELEITDEIGKKTEVQQKPQSKKKKDWKQQKTTATKNETTENIVKIIENEVADKGVIPNLELGRIDDNNTKTEAQQEQTSNKKTDWKEQDITTETNIETTESIVKINESEVHDKYVIPNAKLEKTADNETKTEVHERYPRRKKNWKPQTIDQTNIETTDTFIKIIENEVSNKSDIPNSKFDEIDKKTDVQELHPKRKKNKKQHTITADTNIETTEIIVESVENAVTVDSELPTIDKNDEKNNIQNSHYNIKTNVKPLKAIANVNKEIVQNVVKNCEKYQNVDKNTEKQDIHVKGTVLDNYTNVTINIEENAKLVNLHSDVGKIGHNNSEQEIINSYYNSIAVPIYSKTAELQSENVVNELVEENEYECKGVQIDSDTITVDDSNKRVTNTSELRIHENKMKKRKQKKKIADNKISHQDVFVNDCIERTTENTNIKQQIIHKYESGTHEYESMDAIVKDRRKEQLENEKISNTFKNLKITKTEESNSQKSNTTKDDGCISEQEGNDSDWDCYDDLPNISKIGPKPVINPERAFDELIKKDFKKLNEYEPHQKCSKEYHDSENIVVNHISDGSVNKGIVSSPITDKSEIQIRIPSEKKIANIQVTENVDKITPNNDDGRTEIMQSSISPESEKDKTIHNFIRSNLKIYDNGHSYKNTNMNQELSSKKVGREWQQKAKNIENNDVDQEKSVVEIDKQIQTKQVHYKKGQRKAYLRGIADTIPPSKIGKKQHKKKNNQNHRVQVETLPDVTENNENHCASSTIEISSLKVLTENNKMSNIDVLSEQTVINEETKRYTEAGENEQLGKRKSIDLNETISAPLNRKKRKLYDPTLTFEQNITDSISVYNKSISMSNCHFKTCDVNANKFDEIDITNQMGQISELIKTPKTIRKQPKRKNVIASNCSKSTHTPHLKAVFQEVLGHVHKDIQYTEEFKKPKKHIPYISKRNLTVSLHTVRDGQLKKGNDDFSVSSFDLNLTKKGKPLTEAIDVKLNRHSGKYLSKTIKKRQHFEFDDAVDDFQVCPRKRRQLQVTDRNLSIAKVAERAPLWKGITVINEEFVTKSSEDFSGKYLVLFFYPLDFAYHPYAQGPQEILAFNNKVEEFKAIHCEIVACSVDSHFSHLTWIKQFKEKKVFDEIQITLLSDPSHQISKAFNVYVPKWGHTIRCVFIINPNGIIVLKTELSIPYEINVEHVLQQVKLIQSIDNNCYIEITK